MSLPSVIIRVTYDENFTKLPSDGDDTDSSDEDDPLTSFFRIQMNGLLSGRNRSRRPEPTPKLFTKLGFNYYFVLS